MSVSSPRASRAAASPRPPRDRGVLSFLDLAGSEGRHQISLGTTETSKTVGEVKDLVDAAHGIPASLVAILRVPSDSEEEVLADGDEIDIDEAMSNGKQAFLIRRQSSGSCSTEASSTHSPGSEGNLSGRATPVLAGGGFPVGDERDGGHKEHAEGEFSILTSRPQNDNSKQADKIFPGRGGHNGVCAYSPPAFVARNSSDESSQHHDHDESEGGSCAPPRRGRLRLIVRPASASYETNSWEQLNARGLHACREYLYAIGGVSSLPAIVTFFRLASWGLENMCHAWLLSSVGASARSWEELGFVDPCSGASAFMLACQKFSFQVPALMLDMMSERSLHDHLSQVSRWGVTALLCVREERLGLLILDHLMLAAGAAASSSSGEGPTSACSGNIVRCEPTTAPPPTTTEFFHNSGRAASSSGSRSDEAPTAPFFSPSNRHTAVAWSNSSTVVVPNSFPAATRPRARAAGVLSKPALRMLLADDVLHSSNILHLVGARRYRKLAVRLLELVQAEVASIIEERERNRKQAVGGPKSAAERPLRVVPVVARVHGMQLSAKRWDAAATVGIKAEVAIQRFLTLPDRVNRTPTQFFKEAGWLDLCRTIEGLLEVLE